MKPVRAKISMLGTTGSGKSCFMYGMYAVLRKEVGGFLLGTENPDDDLDFREAWRQIKLGQLPLGNDNVPKSYRFDFRYAMKPLMDFEWIDHRGGVLTGKAAEKDVQAIREHVAVSDCIFLCVSGEHLTESVRDRRDDVIDQVEVARMHYFLKDTPLMPMVLLITKSDLIRHRDPSEIIDDVRKIFDAYFKTDRLIMICPVSIGTGFGNLSSSIVIQPQSVDLPFIFVLYTILKKELDIRQQRQNREDLELASYRGNIIKEWWNSDKINASKQQIDEIHQEMKDVDRRLGHLSQRLRYASIFYKGKKVEVNI